MVGCQKKLEKGGSRTGLAMPSSANGGNVPVFGEANGRQYIIIGGEKAYVDLLVAETFLVNPDPKPIRKWSILTATCPTMRLIISDG